MTNALPLFQRLEPVLGPLLIFKTFIVVFPSVTESLYALCIDGVQAALKNDYIRRGLMIGQFHPLQMESGLHSSAFRPFRAPVPMLAIRHMHLEDVVFLDTCEAHRQAYLQRFGQEGICRFMRHMDRNAALFPPDKRGVIEREIQPFLDKGPLASKGALTCPFKP